MALHHQYSLPEPVRLTSSVDNTGGTSSKRQVAGVFLPCLLCVTQEYDRGELSPEDSPREVVCTVHESSLAMSTPSLAIKHFNRQQYEALHPRVKVIG